MVYIQFVSRTSFVTATAASAAIFGTITIGLLTATTTRNYGALAMATAKSSSTIIVPSLSESIQKSLPQLYNTPLRRVVDFVTDPITQAISAKVDKTSVTLQTVVSDVQLPSVCFVVRRPGCVLCREHGMQLVNMLTAHDKINFHLWGIIKEVGVDDNGLMEFQTQYFNNLPIYHDINNDVYNAFGKRSIFKLRTWNPISIYRGFRNIGQRMTEQNITGNYKGEGIIQGGILIFDATGTIRYTINEEIGTPFDIDKILLALRSISNEDNMVIKESNPNLVTADEL
jgi:AhpC/TSA antioxidant enzyme